MRTRAMTASSDGFTDANSPPHGSPIQGPYDAPEFIGSISSFFKTCATFIPSPHPLALLAPARRTPATPRRIVVHVPPRYDPPEPQPLLEISVDTNSGGPASRR